MTAADFEIHLREIERRNPKEPLLPTLRKGYSVLGVIYMRAAIARLPEDKPVYEGPKEPANADATLRELWRQRTELFGEMNKCSNLFHSMKTDTQRADNSRAIMRIWSSILDVKAKIAHYEENQSLPEIPENEDNIDGNPVKMAKQLNSIRARISQRRKKVIELAQLDQVNNQAEIDRLEEEIKRLKYDAGVLEQKLKVYGEAKE
jgi:hypothetical protein